MSAQREGEREARPARRRTQPHTQTNQHTPRLMVWLIISRLLVVLNDSVSSLHCPFTQSMAANGGYAGPLKDGGRLCVLQIARRPTKCHSEGKVGDARGRGVGCVPKNAPLLLAGGEGAAFERACKQSRLIFCLGQKRAAPSQVKPRSSKR